MSNEDSAREEFPWLIRLPQQTLKRASPKSPEANRCSVYPGRRKQPSGCEDNTSPIYFLCMEMSMKSFVDPRNGRGCCGFYAMRASNSGVLDRLFHGSNISSVRRKQDARKCLYIQCVAELLESSLALNLSVVDTIHTSFHSLFLFLSKLPQIDSPFNCCRACST